MIPPLHQLMQELADWDIENERLTPNNAKEPQKKSPIAIISFSSNSAGPLYEVDFYNSLKAIDSFVRNWAARQDAGFVPIAAKALEKLFVVALNLNNQDVPIITPYALSRSKYFKACSICNQIRSRIFHHSGVAVNNYKISFINTDFLEVKGDIIQALYEESPYLRELYPEVTQGKFPQEIKVNELSSGSFKLIASHLFAKKAAGITWENVCDLFSAAKFLQIPRLQKLYFDWILDEIQSHDTKISYEIISRLFKFARDNQTYDFVWHQIFLKLLSKTAGSHNESLYQAVVRELSLFEPRSLNRLSRHITSRYLNPLAEIKSLESLDISDRVVMNDVLVLIAKLPIIRELDLSSCSISDTGLFLLSSLRTLRVLSLSFNNITDAGIKSMRFLQLQRLNLEGCLINGSGFAFYPYPQVTHLSLKKCEHFNDMGMRCLKKFPLISLDLNHCNSLTEVGISYLLDIPTVEVVTLPQKLQESHVASILRKKGVKVKGSF